MAGRPAPREGHVRSGKEGKESSPAGRLVTSWGHPGHALGRVQQTVSEHRVQGVGLGESAGTVGLGGCEPRLAEGAAEILGREVGGQGASLALLPCLLLIPGSRTVDMRAEQDRRLLGPGQRPHGHSEGRASPCPGYGEVVGLGRPGELGGELLAGDRDPDEDVPGTSTVAPGVPGRELIRKD